MATNPQTHIYRLACLSVVTAVAAVLVPRFVPSSDGGFASAASSVLVFLALLLLSVVVSLAGLAIALRAYADLPWPARIAGIGPVAVLGAALVWIVLYLRS